MFSFNSYLQRKIINEVGNPSTPPMGGQTSGGMPGLGASASLPPGGSPIGGLPGGIGGGLGGGGMPPMGGMPGGMGQPGQNPQTGSQKLKATNIWEILERILK